MLLAGTHDAGRPADVADSIVSAQTSPLIETGSLVRVRAAQVRNAAGHGCSGPRIPAGPCVGPKFDPRGSIGFLRPYGEWIGFPRQPGKRNHRRSEFGITPLSRIERFLRSADPRTGQAPPRRARAAPRGVLTRPVLSPRPKPPRSEPWQACRLPRLSERVQIVGRTVASAEQRSGAVRRGVRPLVSRAETSNIFRHSCGDAARARAIRTTATRQCRDLWSREELHSQTSALAPIFPASDRAIRCRWGHPSR